MGRIAKKLSIITPMQHMVAAYGKDAPFQSGTDLVKWLNIPQSSSTADREAAERVGHLISRMHCAAVTYVERRNVVWATKLRNGRCVATLRSVAPWYQFKFDLYPPGRSGKWRLFFAVSFNRRSTDGKRLHAAVGKGRSVELESVAAVVDLALGGRLESIRRCQVAECGKWFVTKRDFRVLCCPDHSSDDLRKGTPERKEQLRRAAKKAREEEKKAEERALECARMVLEEGRKEKSDKPPSHRAQKS